MPSKRIDELPAANGLDLSDQMVVSTSGRATRRAGFGQLPFRAAAAGSVLRLLADKLGEFVSVKDFGAAGNGVSDDSPAFKAALDAHESVYVPRGRYRLASEVAVKPRRTLIGAGRDATVLVATGARAFTFHRNAGAHRVEPGGTDDWCRSRVAQLSLVMAQGGIKVFGHEFHGEALRFSGGTASSWCLELENANECSVREISAGPGGGADDLRANGIRLFGSEAGAGVNYGDSLFEEISIKLKAPDTVGLLIEHVAPPAGGRADVVNNVLLNRVQVNSAGVPPGTVGIWLKQVMRSVLLNVDVEFLHTAFKVEGTAPSGNAGSCRHLSFINCYVLNCTTPWVDSNASLPGSVMRCLFQNCNGVGPLNPVGVSSTDPLARAGEGDSLLPGALWVAEPNAGQPAIQVRSPNVGQILFTGDFHDGASPTRDGNPKNRTPRQGLGVDLTSFNVTRLYRPRGYASGEFSRLVVGNGTDFKPDGTNEAPLHRIELADPLYLTPRSVEPPQALNGFTVYCEAPSALPGGSPWLGSGWYTRLGDRWHPGTSPLGRVPGKERNASFTVSPLDFGVVNRVNNASAVTVMISSTYDVGGGAQPLLTASDGDAIFWLVRQGTGDVTIAAGDSGVELRTPGNPSATRIRRQYQLVTVVVRLNSTSGKVEVYSTTIPDGDIPHEDTLAWVNANQGSNTEANPYLIGSNRAGQLVRISSSDPVSYVAFDNASRPGGLAGATFRLCTLNNPLRIIAKAGSLMALRRTNGTTSPGNTPYFELTDVGRVVTAHLTTASDSNQPNSIYLEA